MITNLVPSKIPSECQGLGINWMETIFINLPKFLFVAFLLLSFMAHRKKLDKPMVWTVYGLTILAGVIALGMPYLLFGSWNLGWQWLWVNVPLYGCM